MNVNKNYFFLAAICAALAACGGGSNPATPAPIGTVSPTVPAAVTTTVGLSSTALSAAPVTTTAPQPVGYAAAISVPNVSAPANTKITLTSSVGVPSTLPALQSNGKAVPQGVRPLANSGSFTSIFYDSIVPSQSVTVGGAISFTQSFPGGGLSASGQYYLGFYDSTQASPSWVTIAGPVSPSGNNVTFSGATNSFTLVQNALYGFAIFTTNSPTTTPPPAQPVVAYVPNQQTSTLDEVLANGTVATTLPITANSVALDDAGNIYGIIPSLTPQASPAPTQTPPSITEYSPSGTVMKSFTPSNLYDTFLLTSGSGSVASFGVTCTTSCEQIFDIWDAGASGTPSRTIDVPTDGIAAGLMAHDGTLYIPTQDNSGDYEYEVIPPGSSTPSRTIMETIAPANSGFSPNYMAVGPDGTLYVTEYSAEQPDALAGLYIYPPSGPETMVATTSDVNGAGPSGVDVDASGDIYVANNNAGFTSSGTQGDSLHDITVYAPGGTSVLRHITGSFDPVPLAVTSDGTLFFSSFIFFDQTQPNPGFYSVPAAGTSATQLLSFAATSFGLYDGNRETTSVRRGTKSVSASGSSFAGGGAMQRALRLHHRI